MTFFARAVSVLMTALALAAVVSGAARAEVIPVAPGGSKLLAAIAGASPGDTLHLQGGSTPDPFSLTRHCH